MRTKPRPQIETADADLYQLFRQEIADVYDAERQVTQALPRMVKAANWGVLRTAFQQHLEETHHQIIRLKQVFTVLDEDIEPQPCQGMTGLLAEGSETMVELEESTALDAALIVAAQKVEHYEIAAYGALIGWAEQLGQQEVANLLKQNLQEEVEADGKLTSLALALAQEAVD